MKTTLRFLAVICVLASFIPNTTRAFSIAAVTLSPSNVVPTMTELRMAIDVLTPSQAAWLYASTQISSNASGLRVDVFPTSGQLTAIGSLRETVTLGVFPVGTHHYEVVIHPGFQANWGTRTNRGSFTVTADNEQPAPPLVSLETIDPATSEPYPSGLVVPGTFLVSRTGPTDNHLTVFLQYGGTASNGVDYRELPRWFVEIPAGHSSAVLEIIALADTLVEGKETVEVKVLSEPPDDFPLLIPIQDYRVDATRQSGRVILFDRQTPFVLPTVSIEATAPEAKECGLNENCPVSRGRLTIHRAGELDYPLSVYVAVDGTAVRGVDYVLALPDPSQQGFSHFLTLPAGQSRWDLILSPLDDMLAEGDETATLRLLQVDIDTSYSFPPADYNVETGHDSATVVIHDNDPGNQNQRPFVAITRPTSGTGFPTDTAIEIIVEARDPDGYVPKVEFFADNRKIGEASVEFVRPPAPAQRQTFTFVWRQPPPGSHALTARATDDGGASGTSATVSIQAGVLEPLPIVTVTARDSFAVEPRSNTALNTATFGIRRFGPTNDLLIVAYSLSGTADNGIDYEMLSGLATIPAGRRSVALVLRPLTDNLAEGMETVRLKVEQPPPPGPEIRVINPYRVGPLHTAAAAISDGPWLALPGGSQCTALPGGLLHVCFAAEAGHNFRIEASGDMRNWETLFDAAGSDGTWHFIDPDMEIHSRRFYRLAPEPVVEVEE